MSSVSSRAAKRVIATYLKTASPELIQRAFPALSAAFDTYSAAREQERQQELARQFRAYPGLMAEHTMSSMGAPMDFSAMSPPTHHRRHRHHSG